MMQMVHVIDAVDLPILVPSHFNFVGFLETFLLADLRILGFDSFAPVDGTIETCSRAFGRHCDVASMYIQLFARNSFFAVVGSRINQSIQKPFDRQVDGTILTIQMPIAKAIICRQKLEYLIFVHRKLHTNRQTNGEFMRTINFKQKQWLGRQKR